MALDQQGLQAEIRQELETIRILDTHHSHALMARENLARVLADKVAEGVMSRGAAARLARRLLRENALELFALHER